MNQTSDFLNCYSTQNWVMNKTAHDSNRIWVINFWMRSLVPRQCVLTADVLSLITEHFVPIRSSDKIQRWWYYDYNQCSWSSSFSFTSFILSISTLAFSSSPTCVRFLSPFFVSLSVECCLSYNKFPSLLEMLGHPNWKNLTRWTQVVGGSQMPILIMIFEN